MQGILDGKPTQSISDPWISPMIQQPLDFSHQVQGAHVGSSEEWGASSLGTRGVPKIINFHSMLKEVLHHVNTAVVIFTKKCIMYGHTVFDWGAMLDQDINDFYISSSRCVLQRLL